jgi:hypothetical protein
MSDRLGHANVAITQDLYQHVLREMDESAAAAVAAAVILCGGWLFVASSLHLADQW